jgi:predicted pyridoxine 5'-phosphate oxidase superfamily flavin-nucleotide-binding protein
MYKEQSWPNGGSPFHEGEMELQERAGARDMAERVGRAIIRDHMPEQHREFFENLPYLLVGSLDTSGYPWASLLVGEPGFISSPDPKTLHVAAWSNPEDRLQERLTEGKSVGLLGIELHTRRRNRMNGRIVRADERGFAVHVEQSFGNCPQYIQARTAEPAQAIPVLFDEGALLSARATKIIAQSDTFFIASAAKKTGENDPREGVDVSHRGGKPGFVRVAQEGGRTLIEAPDFSGNFAFNTFGNIARNPKVGLLFLHFDTGNLVQLIGEATVLWDDPRIATFPGAKRLLQVRVTKGRLIEHGVPLRWSPPKMATQLAKTGVWPL